MLITICVIIAVIGLILIVLSVVPGVAAAMPPNSMYAGVTLVVLGVILYVVLYLLVRAPGGSPDYGMAYAELIL